MHHDVELRSIRAELGESPVWNAEHEALRVVDAHAPAVHRDDVASEALETWPIPERCGSIAPCRSGRILVALRRTLKLLDPASGTPRIPAWLQARGVVVPPARFSLGNNCRTPLNPVPGDPTRASFQRRSPSRACARHRPGARPAQVAGR